MSVQTQPEQTAFETTDQALVEAFIALQAEFAKTETAPLRAENETKAQQLTGEAAELVTLMKEMAQAVDFETDKLIANRLAANNRKVPLLRTNDAHRVVAMFSGGAMNDEMGAMMAVLTPIASLTIEGNLAFLNAINPDPYTAFWQFVAALTGEAASSGRTLKQAVVSPESRANVYRACMTYQAWCKLTIARCALVGGVSLTSLIGGAGSVMTDSEAVQLDEQLAAGDELAGPERAENVKRYKEFYTRLGQEIWPAGNRR